MSIRMHELPNMVFGKFQDIAMLLCNYWFLAVVALIEVSLLALQIQYIVLCLNTMDSYSTPRVK